ncbi:MAG: TolC family outer membrane protein [Proteobacteria bacterium]|nr:TolC family outer membrane protein [Pseudomonadota bacterium]
MQRPKTFKFIAAFFASTFLCMPSFGNPSALLNDPNGGPEVAIVEEALGSLPSSDEVDAPNKTVSLQETLEQTYMQNTDLDAARAGLRATDETVSQANAEWRPSLSVSGTQQQTQSYPIGSETISGRRAHNSSTSYSANIAQNIYRGGGTEATIGQRESEVLGGRAGLFNQEQATLLTGIQSHTSVLTTEAIANYLKKKVDFYRNSLERAQVRFEVGEGSRTDVEAMKGQYEGAKADFSKALGEYESAKATYLRQVGSPAGNLAPANVILPLPKKYSDALEVAKAHNPVILQARYALEAAEYNVNVQTSELLPKVDVNASAGNNRNGGTGNVGHPKRTNLMFNTTVNVPIYLQGIPNSRIREAYQTVAQQKVNLVGAQRQVVEAIKTAWDNLIAARESVKGYLAQVKAQMLAVEGAVEEVNVGTKTMLDVEQLETNLVDAQINLANAQQTLIVAGYQVLQAMGRLTARDLRLNVKYYDPDAYYNEYKNAWIQFWQGKDLRYVKDGDPK